MQYINLVIMLTLFEYVFFTMRTGKARMDAGLKAPAVSGNEVFERYFRVQQNTLEQIVVFIPAIYLFGIYIHELTAAGIGVLFIIGRALYFSSYTADPDKRGPGMIITMLANVVLLLGALIGAVLQFI